MLRRKGMDMDEELATPTIAQGDGLSLVTGLQVRDLFPNLAFDG